ncbi:MAG: flavin monoamine oxidase family protein [Bradymonadaceae bacterium]
MPEKTPKVDVVVVGAGLSGLTATRKLVRAGKMVLVLEARERVGGRLLSTTLGGENNWVDLGGQWIGPGQLRIAALAREMGVATFRQYSQGKKCLSLGGKTSTYKGTIPSLPVLSLIGLQWAIMKVDRLCKKVPLARPFDAVDAKEWDGMTVETWKQANVHTEAAKSSFDFAVKAIFGAEPAEISFLHFLFYLRSGDGLMRLASVEGGAQQDRFLGGAQLVCNRLAEGFEEVIRYESPVRAIHQDDDGVEVIYDGGKVRAERVIVALAPTLCGRIDYSPPMPPTRDLLTQRMPMGSIIKCIAAYERPFWREKGFSGELLSDTGAVQLGFDDTSDDGSHAALVGFISGDAARHWSERLDDERRGAVLESFARFFGDEALSPVEYVDKNWLSEEWTRGCYAGVMPPGTWTSCGEAMREPVGRIHWAGTETATRWNGYMDGAIEAGERAAGEVL